MVYAPRSFGTKPVIGGQEFSKYLLEEEALRSDLYKDYINAEAGKISAQPSYLKAIADAVPTAFKSYYTAQDNTRRNTQLEEEALQNQALRKNQLATQGINDRKMALEEEMLPYDQALKKAQAEYYSTRNNPEVSPEKFNLDREPVTAAHRSHAESTFLKAGKTAQEARELANSLRTVGDYKALIPSGVNSYLSAEPPTVRFTTDAQGNSIVLPPHIAPPAGKPITTVPGTKENITAANNKTREGIATLNKEYKENKDKENRTQKFAEYVSKQGIGSMKESFSVLDDAVNEIKAAKKSPADVFQKYRLWAEGAPSEVSHVYNAFRLAKGLVNKNNQEDKLGDKLSSAIKNIANTKLRADSGLAVTEQELLRLNGVLYGPDPNFNEVYARLQDVRRVAAAEVMLRLKSLPEDSRMDWVEKNPEVFNFLSKNQIQEIKDIIDGPLVMPPAPAKDGPPPKKKGWNK